MQITERRNWIHLDRLDCPNCFNEVRDYAARPKRGSLVAPAKRGDLYTCTDAQKRDRLRFNCPHCGKCIAIIRTRYSIPYALRFEA